MRPFESLKFTVQITFNRKFLIIQECGTACWNNKKRRHNTSCSLSVLIVKSPVLLHAYRASVYVVCFLLISTSIQPAVFTNRLSLQEQSYGNEALNGNRAGRYSFILVFFNKPRAYYDKKFFFVLVRKPAFKNIKENDRLTTHQTYLSV